MHIGDIIFYVGIGLSCIFMVLKLTGKIRWSWLLVFFPLWGPLLFAILAAFLLPLFLPVTV